MPPAEPPSRLLLPRFLAVLSLAALAAGMPACGGSGPPYVDPRPLGDAGGLVDRALFEGGSHDSADSSADRLPGSADSSGGDSAAGDGSGGDGSMDASGFPTRVDVIVAQPAAAEISVASQRFTPQIAVQVSTAVGTSDDVKSVDAELWTTDMPPVKVSTTRLALLQKGGGRADASDDGAVVGAGAGAPDGGGAGVTAADAAEPGDASAPDGGSGPGPHDTATFTFGDTPIDLSVLGTGGYQLRVTAVTLMGMTGMTIRSFRIDAGPIIRVIAPVADQAGRGSMFASVEVIDPFSDVPPTVAFSVAGLAVAPLSRTANLYQATILETIAAPALSGPQLLEIRATDTAGVAAHPVVVRFVFDDVGPTISNASPATGDLIGGIITIQADVDDPAGVDPTSVVAVVAHGDEQLTVQLDRDPTSPRHFAHLFDTRRLSTSVLYPTISFRASDVPGNQSNIGYTVAVDNTPPLADLDPPSDLRARKKVDEVWRCSWPFDPLGTDAVNEGDLVHQVFDVRARVEDQGNTPAFGGADITPLSGLDPAHVELLVLDDTNRALLVDSDGDGVCDHVNPILVPTTTPMSSQDALMINLAAVPPTGNADFTPDPSILGGLPDCGAGTDPRSPIALCRSTDLSIAIPTRGVLDVAGLWTIPKVVPTTAQCVGNQLDSLGNHLSDGPACLAIRAFDQLGNLQVSRVLHVCIDHDGVGGECPFRPVASIDSGATVRVTTPTTHGLATGDRILLGGVPTLHDVNGLWRVTVDSPTTFRLDGASGATTSVATGQFMVWTSRSDCTGRQTSMAPIAVDDLTSCRPWRAFPASEHLDL